jgi:beta-glucosidase
VDAYMNRAYLDPVLRGNHPPEMPEIFGPAWDEVAAEDLTPVRERLDFLGINYYTRAVVRHDDAALPAGAAPVRQRGTLYTETDWEVHPPSLTRVLRWVDERYGPIPLYVTENGAAFADPPLASGPRVEDPLRVDYYREHLRAVRDARAAGVDVRGYFAWSLLDNYEWSHGYSKRFGLFHVDFESQRRTPKTSAAFYRRVIASRGAVLDDD